MKVLHLISGGETGGSKNHLMLLLKQFPKDEIVLAVMQKGPLYEEAKEQGLDVRLFQQQTRYDLRVISELVTSMKQEEIFILHTHGPRANLLGLILKKRAGCLWVTTVHSDPRDDFIRGGLKGKIFTQINLRVLKKIDHYFAVSNRFKEMLKEFGIKAEKITPIYNGIAFDRPLSEKLTRSDLNLTDEDFVITMIARLHPIKGHVDVLNVVKRLEEKLIPVKLLLVGDGPLKNEIEQAIHRLNLGSIVKCLGFQEDVHSYLSLSDVKLLASYSESFPLVLLEAARAKIPVISTDVGGVKDLISEPELGWVVPVKDGDRLYDALYEAYEKKQLGTLPEYGERLFQKASSTYSIEHLYREIREAYQSILKQKC